MGQSRSQDALGSESRPWAPTGCGISVAAGRALHGACMADSGQAAARQRPAQDAIALSGLEGGRTPHEVVPRLAGPGAGHERDLGPLGRAPTSADVSASAAEGEHAGGHWLMRPTHLVRTLNGAGRGEVISERQLYRHRERAGTVMCRGRKVDVIAYAAWLTVTVTSQRQPKPLRGPVRTSHILRLLERQEYRCALTGRRLSPDTAALDHIFPVSRGGAHRIENAQVLDKQVNRAKGTLTNEEFIQLCREVLAHAASAQASEVKEPS